MILATKMWYKIGFIVLLMISCNPVKRALQKKAEIDIAIAKWVLDNPTPIDSVYITGDEVIIYRDTTIYDTAYSSVTKKETVRVTKFVDRQLTRTDTIVKTVVNDALIRDMLNVNNNMQGQLDRLQKDRKSLITALSILGSLFLVLLFIIAYKAFN